MSSALSQLSKRDLERLSAFVDGELNARQQSRLQARLAREPSLRRALAELEATVGLMRQLPRLSSQRSFSLTPKMVGETRPGQLFPWLQAATVIAAFAFVATIGLDVVTSRGGAGPMAAAPAAQEMAERDVVLAEEQLDEQAPAAELESAAGAQVGEALEMAGTSTAEVAGEAQFAAESEAAADAEPDQAAPSEELPAAELRAAATGVPTAVAQATSQAPPAVSGELGDDRAAADGVQATAFNQGQAGVPLIRFAEIGLGLLLVGLVLINWRRRS